MADLGGNSEFEGMKQVFRLDNFNLMKMMTTENYSYSVIKVVLYMLANYSAFIK